MAQVKIKEGLASVFRLSVVLIVSGVITFLLSNSYFDFFPGQNYGVVFSQFFSNTSLPVLYGTLIGLLLSSFAIIIAVIPIFSSTSLKQPIFTQINRLYTFSILDGILLLIIYFTNGIIPDNKIPFFIYIEIFFFLSLIIGLIFCVLTLSDLFKIIRVGGARDSTPKGGTRGK